MYKQTKMIKAVLFALVIMHSVSEAIRCDRRPFRTPHAASPANGRFTFRLGADSSKYIPQQQYLVTLSANDEAHWFTAFMVWPEGQVELEQRNPRSRTVKDAGLMRIHDEFPVKISDKCPNTIEMINAAPTGMVQMYWESPRPGNECVTLHAMVAENEEVWYQDGEGLMIKVCEDDSFLGDMSGILNENCTVCEEAKYELTFQGKWSRNTHPHKFPENDWRVYYSDLVGASHSTDYSMWKDGSSASEPMAELALFNDTIKIEDEILQSYATGHIRTLIKGKGHGPMNGEMNDPTYALVRVDNRHHLISTATALRPSPDWFLGISAFELCQLNNTWLPYKSLDLIPWDAGVNKAISYESPEERNSEPVGRVRVGSFNNESPFYNMNYKQVKPFATISLRLIRTYSKECTGEQSAEAGRASEVEEKAPEPETPARRTSPPPNEDSQGGTKSSVEEKYGSQEDSQTPASDDECPLSKWEEWTPCSNLCGKGYRSRERHHIVNGVEFRYYKSGERKPYVKMEGPKQECLDRHPNSDLFETDECESTCSHENLAMSEPDTELSRVRQSRMTVAARSIQNCVMTSWSRWSACSGSCDEGSQIRTRSVIKQPNFGGRPCPRKHLDVRKCILDPCLLS